MPETEASSKRWLWMTLLLTIMLVLIVQIPLLRDLEYVDEDLRFFYWLHRFSDPSLFESDPLLGYQFAEVNFGSSTLLFNKVSLFYGSLYGLLSHFLTPFAFSKLLVFPLALLSSYYLFRISERLTSSFIAFLLSTIFTLIISVPYSSISLASGLPRSFTLPLLLGMLYYVLIENYLGMAVILVLSLFYPPVFLITLLTYGIKYGVESLQSHHLALTGKPLVMLGAALFLSILLLLPAVSTGLNTVPTDSDASAERTVFSSPLFGDDGRYPLLYPNPLTANGGLLDSGLIGFYGLALVILLIPIFLSLRDQFVMLPAPFWYLLAASLFGFGISWLAILLTPSAAFHMPSRYTRGTVFIISLILFILNAPLAIKTGARYLVAKRGQFNWLLAVIAIIGFLAVLLSDVRPSLIAVIGLLLVSSMVLLWIVNKRSRINGQSDDESTPHGKVPRNGKPEPLQNQSILVIAFLLIPLLLYLRGPDKFYRPVAARADLVNFIGTLPKDVLISGYPCYLNDIPLYAQRTVLFSCETESRDMKAMIAALEAYFAESEEELLAFCQQYGIDYIVASSSTFTTEFRSRERIIFEPLNSTLRQILEGRDSFALDQISEDQKVYQNDPYFVVACTADFATLQE